MTDIDIQINLYQRRNSYEDYIFLNTDIWETLKTGGELPSLLNPTLLISLSIFYAKANEINSLYDKILNSKLSRAYSVLQHIEKKYIDAIQIW